MYPAWELNQWRYSLQADTQSTEPHQPGLLLIIFYCPKWLHHLQHHRYAPGKKEGKNKKQKSWHPQNLFHSPWGSSSRDPPTSYCSELCHMATLVWKGGWKIKLDVYIISQKLLHPEATNTWNQIFLIRKEGTTDTGLATNNVGHNFNILDILSLSWLWSS